MSQKNQNEICFSISLLYSQGCKFVCTCYFQLINYVFSVLLYTDLYIAHGDFSPLCITNLFHTNVNFKVFFKIRRSEHALTRKLIYKGSRLFLSLSLISTQLYMCSKLKARSLKQPLRSTGNFQQQAKVNLSILKGVFSYKDIKRASSLLSEQVFTRQQISTLEEAAFHRPVSPFFNSAVIMFQVDLKKV